MVGQGGQVTPGAIGAWGDGLAVLHARIAGRFARSEVRERVRRSLVGLLSRVERKNGWQLVEAKGGAPPRPALIPLTVPEVRRLLLALAKRGAPRAHCLRWSMWRRAHQALANRCHARR